MHINFGLMIKQFYHDNWIHIQEKEKDVILK